MQFHFLALLLAGLAGSASAATLSWSGGGGANANWNTSANWGFAGTPASGDTLVFPAGQPNLLNTNNIAGLVLNQIRFAGAGGGYDIRGNAFTLTNNIQATNTVGTNILQNSITLSNTTTTVNVTVALILSGSLGGSVGVTKTGAGRLTFSGGANNTYSGPTLIIAGTFDLGKTGGATSITAGSLNIAGGTVRELASNQVGSIPVAIANNGTLNLNGFSDTIGNSFTFDQGNLITGGGTLFMEPDTTITIVGGTSSISGNVSIGSGTLTIEGIGTLFISANLSGSAHIVRNGSVALNLGGANTFTGSVTANGTEYLWINDDLSLGTTNGGTTLNDTAWLAINGSINVTNEALTLNSSSDSALYVYGDSTNSWTGNFILTTNTAIQVLPNCAIDLIGVISGTGNITKSGPGTLTFSGSSGNVYSGNTTVQDGVLVLNKAAGNALPGSFVIGDVTGANDSAVVRMAQATQFPTVGVIILPDGLLDLNGFAETVDGLSLVGGTVISGPDGTTAALSVNGAISLGSGPSLDLISRIGGLLNVGAGTQNIDFPGVPLPVDSPTLHLDARVAGSALILVTGTSGDLYLNSSNNFTGGFTVGSGDRLLVHIGNDFALGASTAGTTNTGSSGFFIESAVANISEPLVLCGAGPIGNGGVLAISGSANWNTNVILACDSTLNCPMGSTLTINGVVSGAGGFTKVGSGALALGGSADNTFSGNTFVNDGFLQLAKTGAAAAISAGSLTIGDGVGGMNADTVFYTGSSISQLSTAVPITINISGGLHLNNHDDDVGPITMVSGNISTGTGVLTLAGDVSAATVSPGTVSGIVGTVFIPGTRTFNTTLGPITPELVVVAEVRGGSIVKTGSGGMTLAASNSFTGAVTVNDGLLHLTDSFAAGTVAGGVTVNGDGVLELQNGIHVGAEPLTLNSTATGPGVFSSAFEVRGNSSNSWAGNIILAKNTHIGGNNEGVLNLLGAISGPGGVIQEGQLTLYFSGATANTYAGTTTVQDGTLVLAKSVANGALTNDLIIGSGNGVNTDVVRLQSSTQIGNNSSVVINSSGLLDLNGSSDAVGSLAGSGNLDFGPGPGPFLNVGLNNTTTTFSGTISGTGNFNKVSTGILTLSGTNTYVGATTVDGTLVVNGFQPQSPVSVTVGATLGGTGTVGNISSSGAIVPGASPGILTSSNLAFTASGVLAVELNGTIAGSAYDQLNVRGSNNLTGAALSVTVGYSPTEGDQYRIINNDGADATVGTFDGFAEGAVVAVGNHRFRLTYAGGTGNDVLLTLTNQFLKPANAFVFSGNGNGVIEANECNYLNLVISNLSGATMTGLSATLHSRTPGVAVTQPFSTYPNAPANSRRTNDAAFQITTLPGFGCWTNVDLELEVVTAAHGTLTAPFSLPAGGVVNGVGVRFDNNTVTPIPDASSVNSTVTVAGIASPLKKVVVLLHITHTAVSDVDVSLIGPDGTTVELTSDNGGVASDYGIDCTDPGRTTFDSAAVTAITAGAAPFVGTFRPEQSLTNFNEKSGTNVNGLWTLRVADDTPGAVGSIRCWSLVLTPAACAGSSGICELCSDVTINSVLGPGSATQTDYVTFNGVASTCGVPKPCPGTTATSLLRFESFTFRNGQTNACVTVTLVSPFANMVSAAYLGSFNPANPDKCVNYLGDAGFIVTPASPVRAYSFNVASNATFVVNVLTDSSTLAPYTLAVSGGDCRPVLGITANGTQTVLDWTTASAGYRLERTNSLVSGALAWPAITNIPLVFDSRFTVTNSVTSTNQFFRLRKPLP